MAKQDSKQELGKGIRALLSGNSELSTLHTTKSPGTGNTITEISVDQIEVNPFQPRNAFDETAINELAASIKNHGIIQPLTIRKLSNDDYQLISGERRLRAAKIAGLKKVPAYIRTADDQSMLEMALVENIQRQDLNPLEVAISLKRLLEECDLTHDALSDRVAKDRSTVTNYIRLLKLPPEVQHALKASEISMGHAKAILSLDGIDKQLIVFREIIQKQLSVRATEEFARSLQQPRSGQKAKPPSGSLPFQYEQVRKDLTSTFDTKVDIQLKGKSKGFIQIHFNSDDEFNHILDQIK